MSALRLIPPLALSACAISSIVSSLRSLPAPAPVVARAPVLDWNDAGTFVVDPRGVPIAGAHVAALPHRAYVTEPQRVRTDARGHFQLAVAAVYDLWISVDEPDTSTLPPRLFARVPGVAPPFYGQRFVVAPTTRYAVRVQDEHGEPARFLAIEFRTRDDDADFESRHFDPVWGSRKTDEHGELVVWSVPGVQVEFIRLTDAYLRRQRSIAISDMYGSLVFGPNMPPLVVER